VHVADAKDIYGIKGVRTLRT